MDLDAASSGNSGTPQNQNQFQIRKSRAIAAQACDKCHTRKQRCDETRPTCGSCQRMNLECNYRELQPMKKDKVLVDILDRLTSLEGKVNRIPTHSSPPSTRSSQISLASQNPFSPDNERSSHSASLVQSLWHIKASRKSQPYRYTSAAHRMLTWPAIRDMLLLAVPSSSGDIKNLETEGSAFLIRMQMGLPLLPQDEMILDRPFVGMQTQATRAAGGARNTFPSLTYDIMHRLASRYFDTFNLMYPFMDRQNFLSDTLAKVNSEGFDGDTDSVIALLVFALGELAQQGLEGESINTHNGRPSGLRGGSLERPPGLALFNEARKRIGFVLTDCDLENVQIFSLAALYYQSCSRYVDFWKLTVSASQACQVLVTCNPIDWGSQRSDLIRRAYWHCVIMETGLHLELDLPLTGLIALEDRVSLPNFSAPLCKADECSNQQSYFEAYYASQIALRRLCVTIHAEINDSMINTDTPTSSKDANGPTAQTLKHLASQLDQWREMLPYKLKWPQEDPLVHPPRESPVRSIQQQNLDPLLRDVQQYSDGLFTADLDSQSRNLSYVYDIQVALLRTTYYYAKYMVHRPDIYKALHFPEQLTQEEAEGAADCLKACLKWPLTFSPPSRHKRLIPHLFCWSQNFLGILLILHMSRQTPILRQIRQSLCGQDFEADAAQSVELMLDWIQDLKSSDPIAKWCYGILRGIYPMENS